MTRRLALVSLTLAVCSVPALAAQACVVDDDPGGDFTTIQAAISAAQPGDRILVQPGSYGSFTLRKGPTIVGYGTPTAGWAQINDVPLGQVASLVGFDLSRHEGCQGLLVSPWGGACRPAVSRRERGVAWA